MSEQSHTVRTFMYMYTKLVYLVKLEPIHALAASYVAMQTIGGGDALPKEPCLPGSECSLSSLHLLVTLPDYLYILTANYTYSVRY